MGYYKLRRYFFLTSPEEELFDFLGVNAGPITAAKILQKELVNVKDVGKLGEM